MNDTTRRGFGAIAAIGFITCIALSNYLTTQYGLITILGVTATAGTLTAGITFILRDAVQDAFGKTWVIALIALGIGVSLAISDPFIAAASAAAFGVAELVDLTIYTPLRERGYLRAATASNIVGAFVDTVVFLWVAGFPIWSAVPGQMVGKLISTGVVIVAVAVGRIVIRSRSLAVT